MRTIRPTLSACSMLLTVAIVMSQCNNDDEKKKASSTSNPDSNEMAPIEANSSQFTGGDQNESLTPVSGGSFAAPTPAK